MALSSTPVAIHASLTAAAHPAASTSSNTPIFIVPNGTFFAELILFIVVLGVVAKFILPPIQQAMDERAKTIRAALQASDEGHVEAERLRTERIEVLTSARSEARSIL